MLLCVLVFWGCLAGFGLLVSSNWQGMPWVGPTISCTCHVRRAAVLLDTC